ncbi:MAG TPA: NAD(P)-dependent oxidoreductase, partial [Kofleriaceae bacterium]|nr:NAD(P)-dependent oxidoreductase [Kofleriaceae bacterium]
MSFLAVSSAALPVDIRPILGPGIRLVAPSSGHWSRADFLAAAAEADGVITIVSDRIDDAFVDAAPRLKVIANFAVGYDNVDVAAATGRRIWVTNTPDVLTEATADFTWALLLAAARRIVEGDDLARSGRWTGWEPGQHLGLGVHGQTLGIIGLGRIGRAVACRGAGFAMRILYAGPRPSAWAEPGWRRVEAATLFAEADFVSLHCPLSPATHHMVDARVLATMKPTAILINPARGGCVDEAALGAAIAAGQIAGAGLDVFAAEPAIHPSLLASER